MKKWSITVRVTLWYTLFMLLILVLLFSFIKLFSYNSLKVQSQNELKELVLKTGEEIEYQNGTLHFGRDMQKLEGDIYLSIYDLYGNLLTGGVPRAFPIETSFDENEMMEKQVADGQRFFYYDELLTIQDYGELWVRGVTSYSNTEYTLNNITMISIVSLPVIFILVSLGGYIVTKKALKPVEDIRKTAEQISAGEDLSIRLSVGKGKGNDEIDRLSSTFDSMFERLQKAFEREKQFTSDISHELRTPISVILLNSSALLQSTTLSDEERAAVEKINTQTKKMSELIAQMMLLARTETNQLILEKEEINVKELIQIIIEENRVLASEKKITLTESIPETVRINADRGTLIRVVNNLVTNAISYNKENGSVEISWKEQDLVGFLTVQDTGIGMNEEHLQKIWNRFYRVDPARSEMSGTSSGLGLSMVQWLVNFSGWSIDVSSQLGEGSCFTLKIPLEDKS